MLQVNELARAADLQGLQRWIDGAGLRDIADALTRLPPKERALVFRLLERNRALAVFEMLEPIHQQGVLEGLRDDRFRELVESMEPDDRARLVGELPAKVANRVLSGLSPRERAMTAALLGYAEETAGRIMSPAFVNLLESMTVGAALEKVRQAGAEAETVYTLPVTDHERRLRGIVSLRQLVLADPKAIVGDLMVKEVHAVHATDDQEVAARLVNDTDVLALPVLDSEDRVVGILTIDDAMRVLEHEETEDLAFQAGSQPLGRPYLTASVLGLARSRAVWLLILIVAATLTVNVLKVFEDTLEEVVSLALFIPLLIGTGGNSGTQASTVVIRAMAVGEVRITDLPTVLWREARVGVLLGLMLAVVAFGPVAVLFDLDMALVISITILSVCTWATCAGSMLPILARRVGVDPAVVSAPVITTLVDASGLVIYFLVARAVLGV